jgi:hypothetical protein
VPTLIHTKKKGSCADCEHCRIDKSTNKILCIVKKEYYNDKNHLSLIFTVSNHKILLQAKCKDKFKTKILTEVKGG